MTHHGHATTRRFVALLRGINVGGKNKLPMRELVAIFEAVGCEDVTTYIQSGNVVFSAPPVLVDDVAPQVSERIDRLYGLKVPVVLRTGEDLAAVVEGNPFAGTDAETKALHVLFLRSAPAAECVERLDPDRSPGDSFVIIGREVYLHCPNGIARTKLTNQYFDSLLATTSAGRNWRTVLKLASLSAG